MNLTSKLRSEFARKEVQQSIKFIAILTLAFIPQMVLLTEYYKPLVDESYKEHKEIIKGDIIFGLAYITIYILPIYLIVWFSISIAEAVARKFGWLKYGRMTVRKTTIYQHGNCSLEFYSIDKLEAHIRICDGSHDRGTQN